ncbi:MAG: EamA family transporter, partial [Aliihoeflea sp.]
GYYITPLVTVLMGAVLLGERLSRAQVVAVGLAAIAVAILTWDAGGLPWVSLVLAFTFAGYGFLRKTLQIVQIQGFLLEVLILTPTAILWLGYLAATGPTAFGFDMPLTMALLILCGPATAIPLILYAFGAKLLKISSIGIMQYIAPTIIATIAVFVFGEPFGTARLVAFGFIWAALAIYTWSMFSQRKLGAAEAVAATSAR